MLDSSPAMCSLSVGSFVALAAFQRNAIAIQHVCRSFQMPLMECERHRRLRLSLSALIRLLSEPVCVQLGRNRRGEPQRVAQSHRSTLTMQSLLSHVDPYRGVEFRGMHADFAVVGRAPDILGHGARDTRAAQTGRTGVSGRHRLGPCCLSCRRCDMNGETVCFLLPLVSQTCTTM